MTNQPIWKAVANLGDANPVDHGGFFVLVDQTGVYCPEAVTIETPVDAQWSGYWEDETEGYSGWHKNARWTVSRVPLEPNWFEDGCLSDNEFHKNLPAWYGGPDSLESVSSSTGMTVRDLITALTSKDTVQRAFGYRELAGYYGAYEFDQTPLELSEREVTEQVETYFEQMKS